MIIRCVKCQEDFVSERVFSIWDGEVEVQYFRCSVCGARYQVITTDMEMRRLIQKRKALTEAVKAAKAKGFRGKAFRKYEARLEKVKAEQMKLVPALNKRGEEILKGEGKE